MGEDGSSEWMVAVVGPRRRGGLSFLHRGSALFSSSEVKPKLAGGRAGPLSAGKTLKGLCPRQVWLF